MDLSEGRAKALFTVPTKMAQALVVNPVLCRGSCFDLTLVPNSESRKKTSSFLSTEFCSPDPEETARHIAERIAIRMGNPSPVLSQFFGIRWVRLETEGAQPFFTKGNSFQHELPRDDVICRYPKDILWRSFFSWETLQVSLILSSPVQVWLILGWEYVLYCTTRLLYPRPLRDSNQPLLVRAESKIPVSVAQDFTQFVCIYVENCSG